MPSTFFRTFRYPAEFALLLALILFIPLFEVPKNILIGLYAIAFVYNRYSAATAPTTEAQWDGWDSLFAVWIASAYIVAAFSACRKTSGRRFPTSGSTSASAGWLKRSGYEERECGRFT
jgi:hypothetical protein